jgi:hypothetical protein
MLTIHVLWVKNYIVTLKKTFEKVGIEENFPSLLKTTRSLLMRS